ncbi:Ig-like domain-containing protein, partial [Patescibacteria group bacterium]|nr:Ig-like domain-containing protein [Patescibacteria group bacterium]
MLYSKRLKEKKYLIVLVFFLFLFFSFSIKFVFAADGQIQDTFGRQMLEAARINAGLSTKSIYAIIGSIIKVILSLFGIFATCIVVYAGVLWMTSKGEPEKINKAKEMMKNALIGMLIVVSSYAITSFLVGKLTGIFGSPTSYEYNTGEDSGTIGGFGSGFNVVSTYPRNEMQNVKTCARVSALFNKDLYADSVNDSSVYIRDEDENKFFNPEKDEYYVSNDTFTFYHNNNDFLKDKIYRVTINSGADGVKSLAGDLLERSKSIWFRTSELEDFYPRVKATYPSQNATGACRNTFVQFQFQEGADPSNLAEMDPTTFNTNNISVEKCTGPNFSNLTCALQSGLEISSISPDSIFSGFTLNFNRMLDANSFYRIILKSSDHNPTLNPNDGIANNCGKPLDGNANGFSDGASVDKYILYFKTGETEKCEPIITNVNPNAGYYNDRFDISGQYFGILGDVSIAGFKANDNCTENVDVDIYSVNDEKTCYVSWGDTLIQAKVPFGSVTGPLKVELTSDVYAQADNDFTVLSPYISKLDPDHGPKGEFIRISGLNFGNNEGKVYFVSFTGTVTEALSPTACSSIDTWKNNEIIRETPNVPIGPYVVIVGVPKEGGGYYYSNYLIYTVTEGEPGPGLCGVEPDQAARGDPVNLVGIRFGTGGGSDKVIFSNVDIPKASTTSWADKLIKVNVPQTAVDGYVSVYANSKESNKVYFNVLSISSGDDIYPVIVDSPGCTVESRSPSAYKNATDACINALVEARFNIEMDTTTFANNMELYSCEGQGINCNTKVIGVVSNNGSKRIVFTPTSNLTPGMWYKAVIKTGVKALGTGKNMQSEYTWNFKTRTDNNGVCDINLLNVLPTEATLNINETTNLTANPSSSSDICAVLKPTSTPVYVWSSDDSNKVSIQTTSVNAITGVGTATILGKAQTSLTKVHATWNLLTDFSDITVIDDGHPVIVDSPGCTVESRSPSAYKNATDACINALVEARFNIEMDTTTFANNMELYSCEGQGINCNTKVIGVVSNNGSKRIVFTPTSNLTPGMWYKAVIKTGVKALGTGKNMQSEYTWNFKTRTDNNGVCDINLLNVLPTEATLNINETTNLTANPSSSSDICAVLKANSPAYTWTSEDESKVEISSTSINPVTTVGIATIEGIAEVLSNKVTARYKNTSITDYADIRVNGEGGIGSSCNTSNDCADGLCCDADNLCTNNFSVCPPRIDEQASCHAENYLVTDILSNPSPYKDKTDACPNINVNVAFDLDMKTDQGHGAINNLANFIVEDCGSVYYENGCNELALEPEQIDVENNKILIWTPVNNLKQNNYYRITISSNVESLYDVKMNSNYVFVFKTRNKNCTITRVDANPGTLSLQNEYYPNGDLTPVAQSSYGLCQSIIVPPGATFAWHTNNVDKVGICSGANYTLCNNSSSNLMNISIKAKAAVVNNLVDVTITLPGDNGVFSSEDNTPQTSLVSVATCSDGIRNWNETSVDSGGVCLITTNPTNGECGIYTSTYSSSSEITHPCTAGDLDGTILYSDTLNKFTWTCRGLNGGNNVNCSANAVPNLNGVCGINQGNYITDDDIIPCAAGLLDPDHQVTFNDLTGKWEWRCLGLGTGIGTDCNALGPSSGNNPVNGVCGSNPGNYDSDSDIPHPCSAGDTSDIMFNLIWRWDCVGLHGGSTAHCNA